MKRQKSMPTPTIYWMGAARSQRLGIIPRPRGGDWLADELSALRDVGVDHLVCLLEPAEIAELELTQEAESCNTFDIHYYFFPIRDRDVPNSQSETLELCQRLVNFLQAGEAVVVHCRQGIGRSALICAVILILQGENPNDAFSKVSQARGCPTPDTPEQRAWAIQLGDRLRLFSTERPKLR